MAISVEISDPLDKAVSTFFMGLTTIVTYGNYHGRPLSCVPSSRNSLNIRHFPADLGGVDWNAVMLSNQLNIFDNSHDSSDDKYL